MMKKVLGIVLAGTLVMGSLVGCGGSSAPEPAPAPAPEPAQEQAAEPEPAPAPESAAADDKIVIGVITKIIDPFFNTLINGCAVAAEKRGAEIISGAAKDTTAVEEQIAVVQDMISKKVDAIIIAPIDSKALLPVMQEAMDAGIAVANFDNKFDDDTMKSMGISIPFIGVKNDEGAYKSAKYLVEALNGEGEVAILEGVRGADNARLRKEGAEKAFGEAPGIEIVASQSANWNAEQALNAFTNMIQANPNIVGVFASCDAMGFGALEAAKAAGKEITVAGFDADEAAIEAVKEGVMLCTVDQNPGEVSDKAVEVVMEMLNGNPVDDLYVVETILITKDNAN